MSDTESKTTSRPSGRSLALGLAGLAILALLAWLVQDGRPNTPNPSEAQTSSNQDPAAQDSPNGPRVGDNGSGSPGRREVLTDPDAVRAERGFRGTVVRPDGSPAPDALVRLFERTPFDPALATLRRYQGEAWMAFAQARTDDQGRFEIGIRSADVDSFQLLVEHPDHAPARAQADLQGPSTFVEIGTIELAQAAILRGRVTTENAPLPIADAVVTIHRTSLIRGAPPAPTPVPTTRSGPDGRFVFEKLAPGLVTVLVQAEGYARAFRTQVEVRTDSRPEVLIEMAPGRTIRGEVEDVNGLPVAKALVSAVHVDTGITEAVRADERGEFELRDLRSGRHRLMAERSGYETARLEGVRADSTNVVLRCARLPALEVRVTRPDGGLQREYDIVARGYYESSPNDFSRLPKAAIRTVSASDLDARGVLSLPGLQSGNYVLEVRAEGFARTFSDPFQSPADLSGRILEIELDRGAAVRGSVQDPVGRPLAGAEVELTGLSGETGPLGSLLGQLSVSRATRASVETGPDGLFLVGGLTPGPYRVLVRHPDHAPFETDEPITLLDGNNEGLPPIRLSRGTLVFGTVSFEGAPAARARVRVLLDATRPGLGSELVAEATTDSLGRFSVNRRLPAGNFTATAERELDSPLRVLIDQKRTLTRFTLDGRRDRYELTLDDSR